MTSKAIDNVMTEEELAAWLDAPENQPKPKPAPKQGKLPTWEAMRFDFKRQLYAKAIGVAQ